jgi:hypothetical protein
MAPRFHHRATGYNKDPRYDRMVYRDDAQVTRLTQSPPETGLWRFWFKHGNGESQVAVNSLEVALELIKIIYWNGPAPEGGPDSPSGDSSVVRLDDRRPDGGGTDRVTRGKSAGMHLRR